METETKINIELPIYESVRESQLQHGLKYDDHRQYRSYCSRRLHRIRRSLNVHQGIAPTAKARHQRAKKLIDVSNSMVLEAGCKRDDYAQRMLIIPLCLAERAWSYAMQLKQEVAEYPRKRFHLVRRLKKAAQYASKFEKLVHDSDSPCSERTKKEATAYAAYMNGLYNMECEQWPEAKSNFNNSLLLYTALSLSLTSNEMVEQYRLRTEELRASLRYCTFTMGEKPKDFKIKLPAQLQFNDIAFKHAKQLKEQELDTLASPAKVKVIKETKQVVEEAAVATTKPVQVSAKKQTPEKKEPSPSQQQQPKQKPKQEPKPQPPKSEAKEEEDEDEDKFEEAVDAEAYAEDTEDDSSSGDEQEKPQQSGGVTGLVKGWLGGAWSGR